MQDNKDNPMAHAINRLSLVILAVALGIAGFYLEAQGKVADSIIFFAAAGGVIVIMFLSRRT